MNLSPENRVAGVLTPLFALRRDDDLGIGDLESLRQFIEWTAEIGFKLVQLLPINETGGDNSPYNAISAMAIEPTTLYLAPGSPPELAREDFEAATKSVDLDRLRRGPVRYPDVKKLKRQLLESAFARFEGQADERRRSAFEAFREGERAWLDNYTLFRALMEENGGSEAWDRWPKEQQSVEAAAQWLHKQTPEKQVEFATRERFFQYVQWVAYDQWRVARTFANSRGVALMGDIPFGVSYYSADVFAERHNFALDWSGGAPPEPYFKDDEFTQKWGQNWGIPLYRWDEMRRREFDWWRQRVRGVRNIFDIFRIDHVLGFYRIYAFPWRPARNKEILPLEQNQMLEKTGGREPHFAPRDDTTPQNCETNRHEGEEYLRMVLNESGATRIVGEDLGTVPNYVRPSLSSLGIAGFKVPQWEVYHGRVTPGAEYERLSVATYCTHDHKPVRALWREAVEKETSTTTQSREELNKIAHFAGIQTLGAQPDFDKDFYPPIMEALFASESWIAVVMITDLLGVPYRFNVPGTAATSNWSRRMRRSITALRSSPTVRERMRLIRGFLQKAGRT